jgi:hypothetical protein
MAEKPHRRQIEERGTKALDAPAFLIDCDQERGSSEHVNLLDQRRQLLKRFEIPGK